MKTHFSLLYSRTLIGAVAAGIALGMVAGRACAAGAAEGMVEQLSELLRTGNTKGVLRLYESLPEDADLSARLRRGVASRYRSAGRYDAAETIYQELLSADITDADARRGLVMTLFDGGEFARALQMLEKSGGAIVVPLEPVAEPAPKPVVVETVAEPPPEPVPVEKVVEPAPVPVVEPLSDPGAPALASDPVVEPVVVKPLSEPAPEPATDPVAEPAPDPGAPELAAEPMPEAIAEPAPEPGPGELVAEPKVMPDSAEVPAETGKEPGTAETVVVPSPPPPEPAETEIVTPVPIEVDGGTNVVPRVPVEGAAQPAVVTPVPFAVSVEKPAPVVEDITEPGMVETGAGQAPLPVAEPIVPYPGEAVAAPSEEPGPKPGEVAVVPVAVQPDETMQPVAPEPDEEPADSATALARVLELFETDRRDEAMAVLAETLSMHPDDTHLLYTKAQIQRTDNDFAGALETCERILELSPDDENVLDLKARLLVALARVSESEEALRFYEQALELVGDDPAVLCDYVLALCMAGRGSEAIARYEQFQPEARESVDLARGIAPCYLMAKQYEKACDIYRYVVIKQPQDLAVGKSLAAMQYDLKRFDDVLETIEILRSHHPDDVELLYTKALVYQDREQYGESLAACDGILAVQRNHAAATDLKAQLLVAQAKAAKGPEAQRLLKGALKLTGDAPEVAESYILSLCRTGKSEEAIDRFEALPADYDPDLDTMKQVARCYFDERRFKEARPLYEAILEEDPNDQTALRGLVTLLFNLGEYNKAVETLSKATLTPADLPGRSSL